LTTMLDKLKASLLASHNNDNDASDNPNTSKDNPFPSEGATHEDLARGLQELVHQSGHNADVSETIHGDSGKLASHPWLHKFVPGIQKWEALHHVGNYVAIRGTDQTTFESMPIYARIGMHLLFYGKHQINLLHNKTVEEHLKDMSIKEGETYDSAESVSSIPSFMKTYAIDPAELLNPDISSYKTMNEFFYRKLKLGARPLENAHDPVGFCSAADCRLMVFNSLEEACDLWIKGRQFNLLNLLGSEQLATLFDGGSLAVFRLAPADYHRFHSPADVTVGETYKYPGQYYTVNPQAVNEPGFDVFTANVHSVMMLKHNPTNQPIAFVAIGALLVGSIKFTAEEGQQVARGDELGYFAYGGSTVIVVFPKGLVKFDDDLVANSKKKLETLVKVGNSLGTAATAV